MFLIEENIMNLIEYINNEKIHSVGSLDVAEYVCVETIVRKPKEFVKIASDNDC